MDVTNIIEIVIALIGALITAFFIPWLRVKTTAAQRETTAAIIKTLVSAAEQIFGSGMGEEKLQYVADMLKSHGYEIDVNDITDDLRIAIESAVSELTK